MDLASPYVPQAYHLFPFSANDEYGIPEIFTAFVEFLQVHPRLNDVEFQEKRNAITILAEFMTAEHQWIDAIAVMEKSERLLEAATQFTQILECPTCGDILYFDHKNKIYVCAKCDKEEVVKEPGAHWFIE